MTQNNALYSNKLNVPMDSLIHRRDKMNLSFSKKCLKIENMKMLFPKKNTRDTRNKSKFIVNKSKSERYKKSAIPTMQKLLNVNDVKVKSIACSKRTVHKWCPTSKFSFQ